MSDNTPTVGPQEQEGMTGVRLAHPLSMDALERLYLPRDTRANVGDVLVVTTDQALSLIGAGFVQVDPDDGQAVATILRGEAQTDVQPSSGENVQAGAGAGPDDLEGQALTDALKARDLPVKGSADERRAAVAAYDAEHPQG